MTDQVPSLSREQLTSDLRSGSAERVSAALESLDRAWRSRVFVPLEMPGPECLSPFGGDVPSDLLARYLSVVENYPDFEPTPSGSERRRALVDALIGYGGGELTDSVALALTVDYFPSHAVSEALCFLSVRGVHNSSELLAAQRLLGCLLDSEVTRQAALDALRLWVMEGALPEVVAAVLPLLDSAEQQRLALAEKG